MKNDFDFIKDKIENSGVNAPRHMDEGYVLNKLENVQPDTSAPPQLTELKPKKRRAGLITGIAAAFVAVVTLSVFGAVHFANQSHPVDRISTERPSVGADIPLKGFDSYDELKAQIKNVNDQFNIYDGYRRYGAFDDEYVSDYAADSAQENSSGSGSSGGSSDSSKSVSGYTADSAGSDSYSETYKQVEGVDEADIVKTDGRYLYIASNDGDEAIYIYSATAQPELVVTIFPESFDKPTATPDEIDDDEWDAPDVFVEELYLYDGKLIAICLVRDSHFDYNTTALVYDITDIKDIKLVDRYNQSGYYATSRMIGGKLYMLTDYSIYDEDFDIPVCYTGTVKNEIPIDCVYSVEKPVDNEMLIVGGYSLGDGSSETDSAAIIGAVEDVYCNQDNLYIYSTEWNSYYMSVDYGYYEADENGSYIVPDFEPIKTGIYKVNLEDGISFTAYGQVEGRLDSRYSLDEKNGYLRVAATVEDKDYNESNRLYILDSDLKEVGRVDDFAKDESIKAVRYVGDTAYVITYEQTDPLFVIDVSDPTSPAILGEVKIDGFSSMLVPVDENTVLGLGYYTEDADYTDMQVQKGFKLALFDVSDKLNPKVLDEKVYRSYYSDVMYEPRALVYNPDRGDYLIPLNLEDYDNGSAGDSYAPYQPKVIGGALNFKVENGKLAEIGRYEVEQEENSDATLINRCLYVGNNFYMISNDYYTDTKVFAAQYK